MESRENKMPRDSCFYAELRCFFIPDFSYHDDIGVLTQYAPETRCKVIVDSMIDLRMSDSFDSVFDWVFQGEDIVLLRIKLFQDREDGG